MIPFWKLCLYTHFWIYSRCVLKLMFLHKMSHSLTNLKGFIDYLQPYKFACKARCTVNLRDIYKSTLNEEFYLTNLTSYVLRSCIVWDTPYLKSSLKVFSFCWKKWVIAILAIKARFSLLVGRRGSLPPTSYKFPSLLPHQNLPTKF